MLWNRPRRLRQDKPPDQGKPTTGDVHGTADPKSLPSCHVPGRRNDSKSGDHVRPTRSGSRRRLGLARGPVARHGQEDQPPRVGRWDQPGAAVASPGETRDDSVRSGGQGIPPREGVAHHLDTPAPLFHVEPPRHGTSTCTLWGDRTVPPGGRCQRGPALRWRRLGRSGRGGERWAGTTSGCQAIDDPHPVVTHGPSSSGGSRGPPVRALT